MNHRIKEKRLNFLFLIFLLILSIYILRISYFTIIKGSFYEEESIRNFIVSVNIPAPRGSILDRNEIPLAFNLLTYSFSIRPYQLSPQTIAFTLNEISELLGEDLRSNQYEILQLSPQWKTFLLAKNVSVEEASPLLERAENLPGLIITPEYLRFYPYGRITSHVIGYVGDIPQNLMKEYVLKGYKPHQKIGYLGIEKSYEDLLRGVEGEEIIKRDARGKKLEETIISQSKSGKNIILTLDVHLQEKAFELLQGHRGVIAVMNVNNGEISALVNSPDFDPNNVSLSYKNPQDSFFNLATQGLYPPGSTLKPVIGLAFLRGNGNPNEKVICTGKYYLSTWERPFLCNVLWGHGDVVLTSAIMYSCNVYFYEISKITGKKMLLATASMLGLDTPSGIDLPNENKGTMGLDRKDVVPGDLLQAGIGQVKVLITPMEMLRCYGGLANNSILPVPHLFKVARINESSNEEATIDFNKESKPLSIEQSHRDIILKGLMWVVQKQGGTAYKADFPLKWDVAGKTGSAQNPKGQVDGWFIGFAPAAKPKWVVLVLLESGGHGGEKAAQIAKSIFSIIHNDF